MTELWTKIGARIRTLREIWGLDQKDLAAAAGLNRTSITNIEAGRQNVQVDALAALADLFGVPIWTLLGEGQVHAVTVGQVFAVDCPTCGRIGEAETVDDARIRRRGHVRDHLNGRPADEVPT